MLKIIYTKGLPASGKSTWARKKVEEDSTYKRVNKDDLRSMIDNSGWSWDRENFILQVRDNIINTTLMNLMNVIVDDTNFRPKHVKRLHDIAKDFTKTHGIKVVVQEQFFDVDVEECIKRDLARDKSVGETVIRNMYNRYLNPIKRNIQPGYNPDLPDAVICDLDGTLALYSDNGDLSRHYDRDFENDICNQVVVDIIKRYRDHKLIIFSGRNGKYLNTTKKWLAKHDINPNIFVMRGENDRRKDVVVKKEMHEDYVTGKYNIKFCIDDRIQVIKLWQQLGYYVVDVGLGFNF